MKLQTTSLILLFLLCFSMNMQASLVTYPAPAGAPLKQDFTVKVRETGGQWKTVDVYSQKVDQVIDTKHHPEEASMAYFDFEGEVEVQVTSNKGAINTSRIRPLSYGISQTVNGNSLTFKLDKPRNLSVEVNGDIFHNLHLFANPIDVNVPKKKKAKNLIYFGPGIHQLPGGSLLVPSGKTVYVAGGAIVRGTIRVKNAHDVKVLGRGYVGLVSRGAGVSIENSRNVLVEGLVMTQCPTGGSDGVTIRNVKSISWYGWGDGMNVFASSNVLYDGVFCRNSDDCTTIYATRGGYYGSSRNVLMQNSTLWADVAHPIFIGIHGNVERPDTIENALYKNIDILDHCETQLDYQGCMAINSGDDNLIRNIRFEDIRVEDFRKGQLVNLRVFFNKKYCKAPGRNVEDISFKNISYNGTHAEVSIIEGYDKDRMVKNVRFENLRINGKQISDDMPDKPKWYKTGDMGRIYTGVHVENVSFVK